MLNQIEFPDSYDLLSKTEFLHGGQLVDFVVIEQAERAPMNRVAKQSLQI